MTMRKKKTNKKQLTLLQAFDIDLAQLLLRVGKDRSPHTYHIKARARRFVADFLQCWEHRDDIPLSALSPDFIERFSIYLSVERGLRRGTLWLHCMLLKGIVGRAFKRGALSRNPFADFHIAKNIRERQYLSEEELQQLIRHHFQDPMQTFVRDVFVFSALTGMSYVDIQKLRKTDIHLIGGHEWIITTRHKTGIPFKVRLLSQALSILKCYVSEDKELIFDKCGYHAIAKRLGSVLRESGIRKHATLHCARHTFAVMALNQGMPIESVSKILGHSNIATTQIYARVTMRKLDTDFQRLEYGLERSLQKRKGFLHALKDRLTALLSIVLSLKLPK